MEATARVIRPSADGPTVLAEFATRRDADWFAYSASLDEGPYPSQLLRVEVLGGGGWLPSDWLTQG
jgi:hypothetical protein